MCSMLMMKEVVLNLFLGFHIIFSHLMYNKGNHKLWKINEKGSTIGFLNYNTVVLLNPVLLIKYSYFFSDFCPHCQLRQLRVHWWMIKEQKNRILYLHVRHILNQIIVQCVSWFLKYKKKKLENSSLIPGQSVECNIGMFLPYSLEIVSPFPLRTRSEIVFHNFFFP